MNWITVCVILCAYGLIKDFRPSEPYLFLYQNQHLNISEEVLNGDVYPYWTYTYLVALVPVFLLTDILLYKPLLLVESICCVCVWLLLIFGRTVWSQQLGQVLYGCATAAEVANLGYMYVKVDREHYEKVTIYTKIAYQGSRLFSYFISQPIVIFHWGTYLTLNYISLGSLVLTVVYGLLLPGVKWQSVVLRNAADEEEATKDPNKSPTSYREFVQWRVGTLWSDAKQVYSDMYMVKWSLWWALTMCGYLQIGNYIQTLWAQVQDVTQQSDVYNGFVEAACPLISAACIFLLQWLKIDWKRWGELWLALAALVDFVLLYILSTTHNIWLMYLMYGTYHVLYHIMITVSQYNLAKGFVTHSYGFIFGLNTMVALALQSAMTFAVVDKRGFGLPIRTQFVIYAGYHGFICLVFVAAVVAHIFHARRRSVEQPKNPEEAVRLREIQ
uniref:Reduced folate carrier n=1 Tax=Steinernema glaseri TaxID=37863 RepID=A0A1I7ZTD6_9BILA